jgi:uncharacterized protein YciI/glutaredoxin
VGLYVVRLERGGPWDWSRDLREQAGWDEHARFMDGLVDAGFILLGGPLEGDRETLHVVEAESEAAIRERLAEDPWARNGMLRPVRIERWTVLLDGLRPGATMSVVLVTRRGCHLCDEALLLLRDLGVHPELADVDADDELHRLYDFRVPVLLVDGAVVAEGRITREQLQAGLGAVGKGS